MLQVIRMRLPDVLPVRRDLLGREPFASIYPTTRCHNPGNDCVVAVGLDCLSMVAGCFATRSRLSDYPNDNFLSWRKSRGDGRLGDFPARAPVRTNARLAANDLQ